MNKWIGGDTATGVVMVKRKQRYHVNCPRCGSENEDLIHGLTCLTQDTKKLRNNLPSDLRMWMLTKKTHPDIISSMILGLKKWLKDRSYSWGVDSRIFTSDTIVNTAITSQTNIA